MIKIEQHNTGKNGFFKALENEDEAGLMTYVWAGPRKIIIEHTEINDKFAGKGIGKQLVLEGVKFARANQIKILPLCPYAKSVFDKNPDLHDVLF
jgi:predicted GNAT family acetyltransferase